MPIKKDWIILTADHVTATFIPPEGDSWTYEIAPGINIRKGDRVYFWSNIVHGFFGWGEVVEHPRKVIYPEDERRGIPETEKIAIEVRREKAIDPPIRIEIMRRDRNLRRLIPEEHTGLVGLPLRPGQANQINDFVREQNLEAPQGSTTIGWSIIDNAPHITVQAVITPLVGDRGALDESPLLQLGELTNEGRLVEGVTIVWDAIIDLIGKNPDAIHEIDPRKLEELVAGAYERAGYEVELTPQSGDRGRDVVATMNGVGAIKIFDQVKRYRVDRPVTANDVRALIGVISSAGNVSKGIISTTSHFAPTLLDDPDIARLVPFRLELKPKEELIRWLLSQRRL